MTAASTMSSAASGAATVSTATAGAAVMSAFAASVSSASSAIAGPSPAARVPSLVSRSVAAEKTARLFSAVASVDVFRVVGIPTVGGGTSSAPPASVVTTGHQNREEQSSKDCHFPTADKSHYHFD